MILNKTTKSRSIVDNLSRGINNINYINYINFFTSQKII